MANYNLGEVAKENRPNAKNELKHNAEQRLLTTLIGCLSRFEQHFGRIWKHGEPIDNLSPNEAYWRSVWEKCRTDILNNGNNQGRYLDKFFHNFEVKWK